MNEANDESIAYFNRIKSKFSVPVYCAPGNHDISDAASLARYRQHIGEDYYSFEANGCVVVVVDTQLWKTPIEGESEAHDAWVTKTLEEAAQTERPIIVVGHYPLFVEQPDEAEAYFNLPIEKRQELLALFQRCGVVAYLTGHTHKTVANDYEGIKLVSGPVTSKCLDENPLGYTLWTVSPPSEFSHEFVALATEQPATASNGLNWHTAPDKWNEPRVYHMPFDDSFALRMAVDHVAPADDPPGKTFSPNGAYWFSVETPDTTQPGPWNATILIDNERNQLIQVEIMDYQSLHPVTWINEKLLYIEVWWGRVLGTDMIFDVEKEAFIYRQMKHEGTIAFQQFQQAHEAATN